MKKLILIALLAFSFQEAMSQITYTGKVLDVQTGQGIGQVEIKYVGTDEQGSVMSNDSGFFTMNLKTQAYSLTFRKLGYIEQTESINLAKDLSTIFYLVQDIQKIREASITAVRATDNTPSTQVTLDKEDIKSLDQSKDFPFLLEQTPATVITSDAGNGVGYTGIRIRGIDPTRVNVTINDIPLNDAESQGVFWVDLPDLASSTGSIQIQRGVGSSTNGAAAFGASINVLTDAPAYKPFLDVQGGLGSFGTNRLTISSGTGYFANGWNVMARGSYLNSDGFIDRAKSQLISSQLGISKRFKKGLFKTNIMLGHERTYQAWWGIPQPKFNQDTAELSRYISQLWIGGEDLDNLNNSEHSKYNYYTYENEVDDYTQNHFQTFYTHFISQSMSLKIAGHYTRGLGYFEQFKPGESLADYNLPNHIDGTDTIAYADVVRRRWLDNHFYGSIVNFKYISDRLDFTFGSGINRYDGRHYGEAIKTEFTNYEDLNSIYYDNDAMKIDMNSYAKATYNSGVIKAYVDMQVRAIDYRFEGPNDQGLPTDQQVKYQFFNPKAGLIYTQSKYLTINGMYARGNREPIREDFVSSSPNSRPEPESLDDLELGFHFKYLHNRLNINLYNMNYTNALVVNGQINDVGAKTRVNVNKAYRRGLEIDAMIPVGLFSIGGNIAFSENKIAKYTEYVDYWDSIGSSSMQYENTDMALSPSVVAAGIVAMRFMRYFTVTVNSKYVGKQYLDNTSSDERMLPSFHTINAQLSFQKANVLSLNYVKLAVYANNISNQSYAPNGYTFSGMMNNRRESFNYVFPMAGANWMIKLAVGI